MYGISKRGRGCLAHHTVRLHFALQLQHVMHLIQTHQKNLFIPRACLLHVHMHASVLLPACSPWSVSSRSASLCLRSSGSRSLCSTGRRSPTPARCRSLTSRSVEVPRIISRWAVSRGSRCRPMLVRCVDRRLVGFVVSAVRQAGRQHLPNRHNGQAAGIDSPQSVSCCYYCCCLSHCCCALSYR